MFVMAIFETAARARFKSQEQSEGRRVRGGANISQKSVLALVTGSPPNVVESCLSNLSNSSVECPSSILRAHPIVKNGGVCGQVNYSMQILDEHYEHAHRSFCGTSVPNSLQKSA
jgi:hypothetical protein